MVGEKGLQRWIIEAAGDEGLHAAVQIERMGGTGIDAQPAAPSRAEAKAMNTIRSRQRKRGCITQALELVLLRFYVEFGRFHANLHDAPASRAIRLIQV